MSVVTMFPLSMIGFGILPLLILLLLGMGCLAAVVFLIVYAIVNKRPAVIAWIAGVAAVILIGFVVMAVGWFTLPRQAAPITTDHRVRLSTDPRVDAWKSSDATSTPNQPSEESVAGGTTRLDRALTVDGTMSWKIIILGAVLFIGLLIAFSRRGADHGGHGRRWVVPLVLILLIPLAFLFFIAVTYSTRSVTRQRVVERNMQEMYEQLNQPRITLETQAEDVSGADGESYPIGAEAEPHVLDEANETNESLGNPVERVARLARLLAAVATQLSDATSSVGRELIALEPTAGNEQTEPAETPPEKPEEIIQPAVTDQIASAEQAEQVEPSEPTPAKPRPAWVDERPKRTGNTWREVIATDEYATSDECVRVTDVYLLFTTYQHLQRITGNPRMIGRSRPNLTLQRDDVFSNGHVLIANGRARDYRLSQLSYAGIGIDYIRREVATDEYWETTQRSFGEMKKLYTLVEFSPTVDRELRNRWDAYRRQERLAVLGIGAGSVLGLIGFVFGLLKVDTWTKGYYTKRLFLGVPAVIIGLVALLALMVS